MEQLLDQTTLETVLWWVFFPSAGLFLLMILGSLIGFGDSDLDFDVDTDIDLDSTGDEIGGDGFPIFTIKNLLAFLTMFSISTQGLLTTSIGTGPSISLGLVCGIAFVIFLSALFFYIAKLKKVNIPRLKNAIGNEGTVYLRIPEKGTGQVNVVLNGSMQTLNASSNGGEIERGQHVKVVSATQSHLIVDVISSYK